VGGGDVWFEGRGRGWPDWEIWIVKWRGGREKLTDGATKEDEVWPSFNQRPDILG